ncbi:TetR family transcriptional regulator [Paenalkalicoccus suaedae]|uniref:TetR family transcriptional regulator n=1 Tax=Paenalkalicoccus suaedae TaxID=2592382 RepID=A0A859FHN8_9BACI|nr:TetR family transcriptional regulator [Paenalkalicoccus suaedae]QKS72310.1 TetR family transcriptional regulator [Paenalkalicoccus suaedae]
MPHPQKYEQLLQAAMELIKENGFEKTSVSQIVKRAGVAQGTYYLYFSSKSEMVPAIATMILEEQLQRLQDHYTKKEPSKEALAEALVDSTFEITDEFKEFISFCYSGMALYYSFERWDDVYRPYYAWLEQTMEELGFGESMSVASIANLSVGLVEHGAEAYYLSNTQPHPPEQARQELLLFLKQAWR